MKERRYYAVPCLDWTEREYHLAGSLGSALLDCFLEKRWLLSSQNKCRVILLTQEGRQWLSSRVLNKH